MYAQYLRIESKAGGVYCTDREFVKACHSVLNKKGKSKASKEARHNWIKAGLGYKRTALLVMKQYR